MVQYTSLKTVLILNVLKFEFQYEWTPPQIFFVDAVLYDYFVKM